MSQNPKEVQQQIYEFATELNWFKDRLFALGDIVGQIDMIGCIETQDSNCQGVLDCSALNWRFFQRNADGSSGTQAPSVNGVPQLDSCLEWNLLVDLVDCEGTGQTGNLPSGNFMSVTEGSEAYDASISSGSSNGYHFIPDPLGGTAEFSVGPTNTGGTACSFVVNVLPCEKFQSVDFGQDVAVGSLTSSILEAGVGTSLDFVQGINTAGIANGGIRQVVPTNGIDTRFLFEYTIEDCPCYTLTQTLLWETDPASFGGASNFQTTKLGYGLASATPLDGGQVDPSRFSIRFVQFNGNIMLYSYLAERPGTFGEYLNNGSVVPVTPGTPQVLSMTLCQNTGTNDDGTLLATVDGVVVHQDSNVVVQTSNQNITSLTYGTFFGGSGTSWQPTGPQVVNIYDLVLQGSN